LKAHGPAVTSPFCWHRVGHQPRICSLSAASSKSGS